MKKIPSISNQINENKIFGIINKDFSKLAPKFYHLITNWHIRAYEVFGDIDKFIILIYLINKDLIFFRKNGLIIDYDTFYREKVLEIPKINISDISKDLHIPKESVRRKVQELEKRNVIKKTGKKIFLDRSAFITAKAEITLKDFSELLKIFNQVLKEREITERVFDTEEIISSMKKNFSFCWYQFYKFLFIFTNRGRKFYNDLETLCIFFVVLINTVENKDLKIKHLNRRKYAEEVVKFEDRGVNAMSLSDITGIPRPTVVRKLKNLKNQNMIQINDKKLISANIKGESFDLMLKAQKKNMAGLSKLIHRIFNQIKVINTK